MSTLNVYISRLLGSSLLIVLFFGSAAIAQTITGSISGLVTDNNGGAVVGASVTLVNDETKTPRNLSTNEAGRFTFAAIQPGTYTLLVEHNGFQKLLKQKVVLSANEQLALGDLKLQPGQVTETVTVTSEGAVVERESSDLQARLTSDQISLISTKGRDITSLLRLLPGTSNNDDIEAVGEGFGTDLPNISGQRGRSTVPTIDGLFAGEPSGSNKVSMTINQDAVAEVKVLRNNYPAEYGNNGGAIINIVSKGGGRDYRGSAYYFLRNESLNANNFFTNKAGLPRSLYRHNVPGFNIGGPLPLPRFGEGGPSLLRNKAFFFFSFEKPHTITPTDPVFVTVPTALERQGDFSLSTNSSGSKVFIADPTLTGTCSSADQTACFRDPSRATPGNPLGLNIIPLARINKSGQALLNYFPLPNTVNGRTLAGGFFNYVVQKSVDVPKRSPVIRIDVKPSNKDSIYWKAQWWTSDNEGLDTSGWDHNDRSRWGILSHYLYKDNGWSTNWVHILNSSMVNEFSFGMRHDSEGFIPSTGMAEGLQRSTLNYTAPQLFPQNNHLGIIPKEATGGFSSVAGTPAVVNYLSRWGETGNDYIRPSFSDNLTVTRGNHSYKFGAYFERLMNSEAPGSNWSGTLNFSNSTSTGFTTALGNTSFAYANAILGNFNSYTEDAARPFTNLEIKLFQWYAQDEWKMNRRLTVSYGMRFGYHSPFFQIDGQGSNFDPTRWDPAKAPLLYAAYCKGQPNGIPAFGTSCSTSNQFAVDPRSLPNPTTAQLLSRFLVRSFVPGTGDLNNGLAIGTDPNTPKGYRTTRPIDWEPRLGVAWDFLGKGKTIFRAMGGVYHAPRVGGGTTGGNLVNNPPANRSFTINNGNIEQLANLTGNAVNFPSGLNAVEVSSHTPTTYNFHLGVQQDIGFKTIVEVSYVGSLSRHLGERRNINQVPDTAKFVDCSVSALFSVPCHQENRDPFSASSAKNNDFLRPYRGYGDINEVMWSGTSNYNSLQIQVNRRYTKGFQYGIAYTYSKSFDYANDDSDDVTNGRPYKAFNYAPSNFDQTHIFTINYIYDLPSISRHSDNRVLKLLADNWQISGTTSYASGKPKNLSVSFSSGNATIDATSTCPPGSFVSSSTATTKVCTMITDYTGGTINAMPNVTCDPMRGVTGSDPTGTAYVINVSCFASPTRLGEIGNMGRNSVRIPAIFNNDLAFFKNVKLGERREIQLRWEVYNIFNRTNFRDIDGGLTYGIRGVPKADGSPGTANVTQTNTRFGVPTSARTARVMQASIRINF